MANTTQGEWPYHEDKHGKMVPCQSNPCSRHSGGDIMATSPEEAYRKANAGGAKGLAESKPVAESRIEFDDMKEILSESDWLYGSEIETGKDEDGRETLTVGYGHYKFVFNWAGEEHCKLSSKLYNTKRYIVVGGNGVETRNLRLVGRGHAWVVADRDLIPEAMHDAIENIGSKYIDEEDRAEAGLDF